MRAGEKSRRWLIYPLRFRGKGELWGAQNFTSLEKGDSLREWLKKGKTRPFSVLVRLGVGKLGPNEAPRSLNDLTSLVLSLLVAGSGRGRGRRGRP